MKYFIIAGEASGDLHGANLMRELQKTDTDAVFRFLGGDLMAAIGGKPLIHYRDMAFMGVWEVVLHLNNIRQNFKLCKSELLKFQPDVVILIDYPGFNLNMAKFAKKNGFRVFYYISPKIWAWKKSRVKIVKAYVDKMFTILPFETGFYQSHDYSVDYIGNPVMDAVTDSLQKPVDRDDFINKNKLDEKPIIALLSGSRKQEIDRCLPKMLGAAKYYNDYQFIIAGAPSIEKSYYQKYIAGHNVKIVYDQTYDLLRNSTAAVVTSGTATLETALFHVPEVVIYKTSNISYIIGRPIVKIKFFSLVNLILDREAVKELLQFHLERDIKTELDKILYDEKYRHQMLASFEELRKMLGTRRSSEAAALLMHKYLNSKN